MVGCSERCLDAGLEPTPTHIHTHTHTHTRYPQPSSNISSARSSHGKAVYTWSDAHTSDVLTRRSSSRAAAEAKCHLSSDWASQSVAVREWRILHKIEPFLMKNSGKIAEPRVHRWETDPLFKKKRKKKTNTFRCYMCFFKGSL